MVGATFTACEGWLTSALFELGITREPSLEADLLTSSLVDRRRSTFSTAETEGFTSNFTSTVEGAEQDEAGGQHEASIERWRSMQIGSHMLLVTTTLVHLAVLGSGALFANWRVEDQVCMLWFAYNFR